MAVGDADAERAGRRLAVGRRRHELVDGDACREGLPRSQATRLGSHGARAVVRADRGRVGSAPGALVESGVDGNTGGTGDGGQLVVRHDHCKRTGGRLAVGCGHLEPVDGGARREHLSRSQAVCLSGHRARTVVCASGRSVCHRSGALTWGYVRRNICGTGDGG